MVRSAAIKVRASFSSMLWKELAKPRTPVRAATPAATARTTKTKRPVEARVSRQAILRAVFQALALCEAVILIHPFQFQLAAHRLCHQRGFRFGAFLQPPGCGAERLDRNGKTFRALLHAPHSGKAAFGQQHWRIPGASLINVCVRAAPKITL